MAGLSRPDRHGTQASQLSERQFHPAMSARCASCWRLTLRAATVSKEPGAGARPALMSAYRRARPPKHFFIGTSSLSRTRSIITNSSSFT